MRVCPITERERAMKLVFHFCAIIFALPSDSPALKLVLAQTSIVMKDKEGRGERASHLSSTIVSSHITKLTIDFLPSIHYCPLYSTPTSTKIYLKLLCDTIFLRK